MNTLIKREHDYAIRICAYLAGYYQQGPIPLPHITQKLFISLPFANKIIRRLKSAGIVKTVQGKFGGVLLIRDPQTLSVMEIMQAVGFQGAVNACTVQPEICPFSSHCQIHTFLVGLENQLFTALKQKMISDFAFTDAQLGRPNTLLTKATEVK